MPNSNPDVPLHGLCPKYVRHSSITPNAKVLYAELAGMTVREGYCYASNEYLGKVFAASEDTVRRWLRELKSVDVISTSYDQTRRKHKRRIYMTWDNVELPPRGWIPAHVRHAPIAGGAKILYAEISSLIYEKDYCFASNRHFVNVFNTTKRTVQNHLNDLEDVRLIRKEHDEDREEHPRRIYLEKYQPPPTR